MNLGKLVRRHDSCFVKDLLSEELHHVTVVPEGLNVRAWVIYAINEDDDAVDVKKAAKRAVKVFFKKLAAR